MTARRSTPTALALTLALALSAVLVLAAAPAPARAAPKAETVAHGLVNPWSLAFLPDGRMLVTERPGRLRVVAADGRLSAPVAGLPPVVAGGQGGLLDVVLDPDWRQNQRVWWSYVEADAADGSRNGTALARGRLDPDSQPPRLSEVQVVYRQQPKLGGALHYGGRIVFDRQGRLFLTLGERFSAKDQAPKLDNALGKIVRLDTEGRAPADNPLTGRSGARPEIWSWGHRNPQGAALHPRTGELWTTEHGPQGGDELNLTRGGRFFGWPEVTWGRNYVTGTRIGEGGERADVEPPLLWWGPTSIAPSGMAFLSSERYPGWQGSLFIGALRAQALVRITLDERQRPVAQERLLQDLGERIRDVRQGPDGWLYLLTDSPDGRILRLRP
ncbi:MAG: hypothetical protein RIQ53_4062 [Pseudomonadota bacterium]